MGKASLFGPASEYVAGELRAQMARVKVTCDELVTRSGLTRATVMRNVKGESPITIDALIPLATALGLDAGLLVDEAARVSGDVTVSTPTTVTGLLSAREAQAAKRQRMLAAAQLQKEAAYLGGQPIDEDDDEAIFGSAGDSDDFPDGV